MDPPVKRDVFRDLENGTLGPLELIAFAQATKRQGKNAKEQIR